MKTRFCVMNVTFLLMNNKKHLERIKKIFIFVPELRLKDF